ncbi:hypothetical protein CW751_04130 [Brumimicrobium salinarum]|uniref:Response regulatory domain-containing protein n=1 Tax=Brumimicrobium salinarum TaxID=2058658 RepID=A0A2I0R560_9FLAO|nr:response regulator [Brumimicrobium salinarum]PKR81723.1 hypothetical protein CW751_04130 [Brumimicrobium salinarum]
MQRSKILIVDDEKDIRDLYCSIIDRHFDLEIYTATSLMQVKSVLESLVPDYVLLDLNLHDGEGFDLIPVLFKVNPKIKILIISAFSHCKEKQRAVELGAVGLLAKPFETSVFTEHLQMMTNASKNSFY